MADLENVAADAVTESEPVTTEAPVTEPSTQEEAAAPSLDDELNQIYEKANAARDDAGRFASRTPPEEGDKVSEGEPENKAIETAQQPSIEAPISLPSELKAQWASVPPAMQEHIAKREAEAHRQITQLGQSAKAYEPFGKLVETNRDVFSNHRRNVAPVEGIAQLLEAQRQLDRDPVTSIAHIARVYGVDLSAFGNQNGEPGNQSPVVASLQAQNQDLIAKVSQLERLVITREEREAQAAQTALEQTITDFVKDNPIDDALVPEVLAQIEALKITSPHLSQKEMIAAAYKRALWSDDGRRQQLIAKERATEEAKKADENKKLVSNAKRASSINVKSSPGNSKPVRTLDDELSQVYDRSRSA